MEIELFSQKPVDDLGVNRSVAVPDGTGVLDEVPWLLDAYDGAKKAEAYWKKRAEELAAAVKHVAGDHEELTLNGKPVFSHRPIETFRGADFKKDHPDLYQAYLHMVEKPELDVRTLKSARPELYKEYQSRQLRIL